jgi:hypothetical protein
MKMVLQQIESINEGIEMIKKKKKKKKNQVEINCFSE